MSDKADMSDRDAEVRAGEFALGVLTGAELAAAENAYRSDPHFAALVEEWHGKFGEFAHDVPEAAPPARTWRAIEAGVFGEPASKPGLWNSLGFWRLLAGGASAVAAASIAVVLLATPPAEPSRLVAALQATGGGPSFLAAYEPIGGQLVIHVVQPSEDATHVPELWLIPTGGTPHSLGLIGPGGETGITVPDSLRPHADAGATLAVSLEPEGGSPTGKPTGPVIAVGKISKI